MAIGDALGAAVEFRARGTFEPVTGYRGGGPHPIGPGDWTDDTSMGLAMAESLAISGGVDREDMMDRFLQWARDGKFSVNGRCFDIGIQTSSAIRTWEQTGDLSLISSEDSRSGNGSIMRLAPVAAFFADNGPADVYMASQQSSATTHPSRLCVESCGVLGLLLFDFIQGGKDAALAVADLDQWAFDRLKEAGTTLDDIDHRLAEKIRWATSGGAAAKKGSGFVLDCLEAALWAALTHSTFESAVLAAVNLGNDADTTGAVAGMIAGARFGAAAIPDHLIDGLGGKDLLGTACRQVVGIDPFD